MKNFFITAIEGLCTLCEYILNIMGVIAVTCLSVFMIYSVGSVVPTLFQPYVEDNSAADRWVYPCIQAIMADTNDSIDWDTAQKECINEGPPQWFLDEW